MIGNGIGYNYVLHILSLIYQWPHWKICPDLDFQSESCESRRQRWLECNHTLIPQLHFQMWHQVNYFSKGNFLLSYLDLLKTKFNAKLLHLIKPVKDASWYALQEFHQDMSYIRNNFREMWTFFIQDQATRWKKGTAAHPHNLSLLIVSHTILRANNV